MQHEEGIIQDMQSNVATVAGLVNIEDILDPGYSHYVIFIFAICSIAWGLFVTIRLNGITPEPSALEVLIPIDEFNKNREFTAAEIMIKKEACFKTLEFTSKKVKDGAKAFLFKEYSMLALFCIIFGGILICAVDQPWSVDNKYPGFPYTTVCFIVGAITSMFAGYVGMMIATSTNIKVTYLCNKANGLQEGFNAAFNGGQVLGFVLVGSALLVLEILILSFKSSVMGFYGP